MKLKQNWLMNLLEIDPKVLHTLLSLLQEKCNNVLHYTENNQTMPQRRFNLMDVAAEYGNYSSDLTRTVPISGRFSVRQKEVYAAVLRVKKEATKLLVPGTIWKEFM